ncbi:MAG: cysteine hydrolase family protein [Oscillospiraceae bacterium]
MKKLLVVVDYQRDFVDGSLGFAGAKAIEGAICEKINAYRAEGAQVAFTFDTHDEHYLNTEEGRHLPVPHCLRNSAGWRLYGRVESLLEPDDPCFEKETFGSFALAEYLRGQQFDQVELAGLVSNICVLSNAVLAKAALPQAHIVVDARCTAGADEKLHRAALAVLQGLHVEVLHREKGEENG